MARIRAIIIAFAFLIWCLSNPLHPSTVAASIIEDAPMKALQFSNVTHQTDVCDKQLLFQVGEIKDLLRGMNLS
jgi:hypothetical protein